MTKRLYCRNCGCKVLDAEYCPECGTRITPELPTQQPMGNKEKNNYIIKGIIIGVCLIIIILSLFVIVTNIGNIGGSGLIVQNVSVNQDWLGQKITADIIPDRDYDYLGATIIYYDSNGAVINTDNLVWNMLNVKKGQHIKMSGQSYTTDYIGNPASAKLMFFDSALDTDESQAKYIYTIKYQ